MGIIIKPLVTEKMTAITDKLNRFGFIVRPEANKLEIKSEVEALYNVTVVDVNTVKYALRYREREGNDQEQFCGYLQKHVLE